MISIENADFNKGIKSTGNYKNVGNIKEISSHYL